METNFKGTDQLPILSLLELIKLNFHLYDSLHFYWFNQEEFFDCPIIKI